MLIYVDAEKPRIRGSLAAVYRTATDWPAFGGEGACAEIHCTAYGYALGRDTSSGGTTCISSKHTNRTIQGRLTKSVEQMEGSLFSDYVFAISVGVSCEPFCQNPPRAVLSSSSPAPPHCPLCWTLGTQDAFLSFHVGK